MASKNPARADQVAGCPPHHWLIDARVQTCKKCGEERPLPVPEPGQWGRVSNRPAPAPVPAPEQSDDDEE
jgi:hypothetical protein